MNIKVLYCLTIFTIIIKILIFKNVLIRARQEKRSSRDIAWSIYQTLAAGGVLERQEGKRAVARCPPSLLPRLAVSRQKTYNNTAKVGQINHNKLL